jgi:hypothetical protein
LLQRLKNNKPLCGLKSSKRDIVIIQAAPKSYRAAFYFGCNVPHFMTALGKTRFELINHLVKEHTMKIIDAIQEKDLKILKVLFDKWKETHQGRLSFDAQAYDAVSIYQAIGITKDQFASHLKNLERIEFVAWEDGRIKLLPSGINYCLGQFDNMRH